MIHKFKKQISFLFAGSFSLVFAACYGMPIDIQVNKTINLINKDSSAIPGLKVTLTNNGEKIINDTSDINGIVTYSELIEDNYNDYKIVISDIDSTENGGYFKEKTVDIIDSINEYFIKIEK